MLGIVTEPVAIYEGFYEPLFRGFLSILLLIMGMEAYQRLHEMKRVAHWFALYAFVAPIAHGLIAFGLGFSLTFGRASVPGCGSTFGHRRIQQRHFRAAHFAGRHTERKPVSLHWLQYLGRYSGSDRYLHPTIYRAGPSGLCLGDTL